MYLFVRVVRSVFHPLFLSLCMCAFRYFFLVLSFCIYVVISWFRYVRLSFCSYLFSLLISLCVALFLRLFLSYVMSVFH